MWFGIWNWIWIWILVLNLHTWFWIQCWGKQMVLMFYVDEHAWFWRLSCTSKLFWVLFLTKTIDCEFEFDDFDVWDGRLTSEFDRKRIWIWFSNRIWIWCLCFGRLLLTNPIVFEFVFWGCWRLILTILTGVCQKTRKKTWTDINNEASEQKRKTQR